MKNVVIVLLLILNNKVLSQVKECNSVFEIASNFNKEWVEDSTMIYKKYQFFDFVNFAPQTEIEDGRDNYYEVGFDKSGAISEVKHFGMKELGNVNLSVNHYKGFKLLRMECWDENYERNNKKENLPYYHSAYFVYLENPKSIYYVNFYSQFIKVGGEVAKAEFTGEYPKGDYHSLSSIMKLDKNLYPVNHFRISNKIIVSGSEIIYEDEKEILKEKVHFFSVPEFTSDYQLDKKTCFEEFSDNKLECLDCIIFTAYPKIFKGDSKLPIWVYKGAHDWK